MSHDRPPDPATDQRLLLPDDATYSTCNTHEREGPTGILRPGDVAYHEIPPGSTNGPWPLVDASSTHASDNNFWSLEDRVKSLAAVALGENSSSTQQFTSDVDYLDPSNLYSVNNLDAESWLGPALQAKSPKFPTSNLHESVEYIHEPAEWSDWDLNQYAAQPQPSQHPDLSYVGMQFDPSHSESVDMSTILMTPEFAQQPVNNEAFVSFGHTWPVARRAPTLTEMLSSVHTLSKTVRCESCSAEFRGPYARGNYGRHRRQKHPVHRGMLECEAPSCTKVFLRVDARLKHYRRHHPELIGEVKAQTDMNPSRHRISISDETQGEKQALLSSTPPLQPTIGAEETKAITIHHQQRDSINTNKDDLRFRVRGQEIEPQKVERWMKRHDLGENMTYALSPRDLESDHVDTTLSTTTMDARASSTEVFHKDGGSIRCDICQKEFKRAAELRRHKDSVHNQNSQQYFCKVPGCNRASRPFPRKDKLADHTARVHGKSTASEALDYGAGVSEATYRCDFQGCEREFNQRADLLRHQRTHTDESERPHKCAQCEKSFLYPKDLKRHQATHLDSEDDDKETFHCEVAPCEYGPGKQGFSRKDGMTRHMRRFHPELVVKKGKT